MKTGFGACTRSWTGMDQNTSSSTIPKRLRAGFQKPGWWISFAVLTKPLHAGELHDESRIGITTPSCLTISDNLKQLRWTLLTFLQNRDCLRPGLDLS